MISYDFDKLTHFEKAVIVLLEAMAKSLKRIEDIDAQ
jgi:hypothetical protein